MKWLGRSAALFLVWLCAIALWIYTGPAEKAQGSTDTAIVLGAAVVGDQPSPVFKARIDHAIALFRSGRVKHVIFTGGIGEGDSVSEAHAAMDYAIQAGVPSDVIAIEEVSQTTHENLLQAQAIMRTNEWQDALIVSDPLHLRRAVLMAEGLGMNVRASATPTTRYQSWQTKAPFLAREIYFIHHYWLFDQ